MQLNPSGDNRNPDLYRDATGPVLRDSIVTYVDELGTTAAMPQLDTATLRAIVSDRENLLWFLSDRNEEYRQRILIFSDNIVVGAPLDTTLDDGGLFYQIFSAALYQLNQACRGRFMRGGITRGPLYMDTGYVTGQGLVDAYTMEEAKAIVPRILLNEDLIPLLVIDIRAEGRPFDAPANRYLAIDDEDGQVFLHYLLGVDDDEEMLPGSRHDGLIAHRDAVATKLGEFSARSRVRDKYLWVRDYHNWVCSVVFEEPQFCLPVNPVGGDPDVHEFAYLIPPST